MQFKHFLKIKKTKSHGPLPQKKIKSQFFFKIYFPKISNSMFTKSPVFEN